MQSNDTPKHFDSGLASLVLAAEKFDKALSLHSLSYKLGLSKGVADDIDICRCAKWSNLKARRIQVKVDQLDSLPVPAITQNNEMYCVIVSVTKKFVQLQHPKTRQYVKLSKDDWAKLSGQKVILLAENTFSIADKEFGFSWFIPSVLKHIRQAKSVLLVSLFIQLIALVTPLLFENVIDRVLVSRSLSSLQVLAIAMLALALFEPAFTYLRSWLFSNLAGKLTSELNSRFYRHLLSLPMSYYNRMQTGRKRSS